MRRSDLLARAWLLIGLAGLAGIVTAGVMLPVVGGIGAAARSETDYFINQSTALCQPSLPQTSKILDADGDVIAHFYDQNRIIVPLSKVPQTMQDALIAVEDVRFYEDNGIDLKGSLRALLANGSSGTVQQGGSTLTQQYVKNVLVECGDKAATNDTLSRKVREAAIALNLARTESKAQILQGYLNIVDFGDGAYGVGAAAEHYFGEPVQQLTLPQSALLAGLVQAPSAYDPVINPKAALARRNTVLGQLLKYDFISQQRYDVAIRKPLSLHVHRLGNGCQASKYPWFCSYVEAVLDQQIGKNKLLQGGLTVRTTMVPKVEDAAEQALRSYVPPVNSANVAGAEAVLHPGTGAVEAIAVNRRYGTRAKKGESSIDYAVDEADGGSEYGVNVGSTAKLFTLATALKEGLPLSTSIFAPGTITVTGYTDCAGDPLAPYELSNDSAGESGHFNLQTGTWDSVNTFYAQLEQRVGLCNVLHTASSLGLHQADGRALEPVPSFVLGAQRHGLTPLDMAAAYAAVAAHGKYCPPNPIVSITTTKGRSVPVPAHGCTQALDPSLADTITAILQGVLTHPGATAAGVGDPGRPAAGKTGTGPNDDVSAFAGYVPQLAAFVWVGHPAAPNASLDGITLGGQSYGLVQGAVLAAPIWKQTFETALEGVPIEPLPGEPASTFVTGKQQTVPDVSGLSAKDAQAALRQSGLDSTVSPSQVASYLPAGTVAYTSPAAGTSVPVHSSVVIYLSNGRPPPPPTTSSGASASSSPSSTPLPPPAHSPPGSSPPATPSGSSSSPGPGHHGHH